MQPAHDGGEAALKRRRPAARLVWWRRLVLLCLILGYCGYYFTRVNLVRCGRFPLSRLLPCC
jgi:sugar phosphate permease